MDGSSTAFLLSNEQLQHPVPFKLHEAPSGRVGSVAGVKCAASKCLSEMATEPSSRTKQGMPMLPRSRTFSNAG